ncbi:MAG: hypothetical protein M3680_05415 [Myxococcota bacterium]|nr:hypothetical protein [Myxococcota bacterium]
MPMPDQRSTVVRVRRLALLAGITLVLALSGAYAASGSWDTAAGVLTGASLVAALAALARRRVRRGSTEASTAARVFGGEPDERDQRVHLMTLAVVGIAALLLTAIAPVVVHLGLDPMMILRVGPYALLGIGALAFVQIDRRL